MSTPGSSHPRRFDPDRYYSPHDPEMRLFGSVQALRRWRARGHGPAFVRSVGRILYLGSVLNEWLDARTVDPDKADGEEE